MALASDLPSSSSRTRILVVEDDPDLRDALVDSLSNLGYEAHSEPSALDAREELERGTFDLVLTDVRMPGQSGIELCQYISGDRPGTPAVVMTALGDARAAVDALRAGAVDFITKPFDMARLAEVIARALYIGRKQPGVSRIAEAEPNEYKFGEIVGRSPAAETLRRQLLHAAKSNSNVLITGEAGTGKELVARLLHAASDRKHEKFVKIDCRSADPEALEAELVACLNGYSSAFDRSRQSLLAQAANGTLLLDEIGDLPMNLQLKLLRALQMRAEDLPSNGDGPPLNVRLIASTRRDLSHGTQSGDLRADLLQRLDVVNISVPPLRKRQQDIPGLIEYFLTKARATHGREFELTHAAEAVLMKYRWPGNVGEIETCIALAAAAAPAGSIDVDVLPEVVRRSSPRSKTVPENSSIEIVERRHIETVLNAVGWNKVAAARTLGIDRATLYRKLLRFGLQGPSDGNISRSAGQ